MRGHWTFSLSPKTKNQEWISLHGLWFAGLLLSLFCVASVHGQTFPRPRLEVVSPPGAKVGSTVEVVLSGDDLDEVKSLYFSDSRIKAEYIAPPKPDPKKKKNKNQKHPIKFKVSVPGNLSPGNYDVRAIGKYGISNPRVFEVGTLEEVSEKESNDDTPEAQPVDLNVTINGEINNNTDVDYFKIAGKKGQRVVVHCSATSIDSQIYPLLELFNDQGRELCSNRNYKERDAVLDYLLPRDGDYYIRLCYFTYLDGGNEHFYRLSISTAPWIDSAFPPVVQAGKNTTIQLFGKNLPGGKLDPDMKEDDRPLEVASVQINPPMSPMENMRPEFSGVLLPYSGTIPGFDYRVKNDSGISNPVFITYTKNPVAVDNEKNDDAKSSQKISLPCTVCGRIEKVGDRDWYSFTAKKGDVFYIEGFADRLGVPVNLQIQIYKEEDGKLVTTIDSHSELPDPVWSIDNRIQFENKDPQTRFEVREDGTYRIKVNTLTSYLRASPRFVYRIDIQKKQPDFRLLLVGNHSQNIGEITLHKGGAQTVKVILFRQDDFDGEVILEAEGLPNGVTCQQQIVGPRLQESVLVFEAAGNAPEWAGDIKVKGTAVIDGKKVVRPAQSVCLVWPGANNVPSPSRLARSLCLAVRGQGPYRLEPVDKEMEVPVGARFKVKIKSQRFWKDVKGNIQLVRVASPAYPQGNSVRFVNVGNTNLAKNKDEAEVNIQLPSNSIPGTYNLVFEGRTKFSYQPDPKNKKKRNVDYYEAVPPIKIHVYDKVADLSLGDPKVTLKAGEETDLVVRVKRLHDYKGDFKVQFQTASGFSGISVGNATIPKNGNEVKLKLKTSKNAKVGRSDDFVIRATARVGNVNFTHEVKLDLTINKAAAALSDPRKGAQLASR